MVWQFFVQRIGNSLKNVEHLRRQKRPRLDPLLLPDSQLCTIEYLPALCYHSKSVNIRVLEQTKIGLPLVPKNPGMATSAFQIHTMPPNTTHQFLH